MPFWARAGAAALCWLGAFAAAVFVLAVFGWMVLFLPVACWMGLAGCGPEVFWAADGVGPVPRPDAAWAPRWLWSECRAVARGVAFLSTRNAEETAGVSAEGDGATRDEIPGSASGSGDRVARSGAVTFLAPGARTPDWPVDAGPDACPPGWQAGQQWTQRARSSPTR